MPILANTLKGAILIMKKLVFLIFIVTVLYLGFINNNSQAGSEDDIQVIPDDAIRLRILAHSDDEKDQEIKHLVRDKVSEQISEWVAHMTDIDDARALIQERLPEIEQIVATVLQEENVDNQNFDVDYGDNVTFPTKIYDTYLYPAGEYEAVLITIGEGKGSNWWCVLFPPLCFVDFADGASVSEASNETAHSDTKTEEQPVKKKFFLFEWFGWT